MGIRETLNKNQKAITAATIAILVIAIAIIVWQLLPESAPGAPTKAYFSDDDGKTFFVDDISRIPPYKRDNNKIAVRAHVFKCESGGEPFVGYLEQYAPPVAMAMQRWQSDPANKGKPMPNRYEMEESGRLFKKPGDPPTRWVSWEMAPQIAGKVQEVKCPDGNYAIEIGPEE